MSLTDYAKARDKFQLGDGRHYGGFIFPCCDCKHVKHAADMEPCRTCDHNANAEADAEAATPPVRSQPSFSLSRFRSVLVKHGVIVPEAIVDPEGYDGGLLRAATREAYEDVMPSASLDRPAASAGTVGGVVGKGDR